MMLASPMMLAYANDVLLRKVFGKHCIIVSETNYIISTKLIHHKARRADIIPNRTHWKKQPPIVKWSNNRRFECGSLREIAIQFYLLYLSLKYCKEEELTGFNKQLIELSERIKRGDV